MDRLIEFWKQSAYYELLHLRVFTQSDALKDYLRLRPSVRVLAADLEVLRTLTAEEMKGIIAIALTDEQVVAAIPFSYLVENPYQPLQRLFQKLMEHCQSGEIGEEIIQGDRNCRIVGITSIGGGTGKSTVAFHLANVAVQSGLRTFLFNVDPIQEYGVLFQGMSEQLQKQTSLSHLFYYLKKAEGETLSEPLCLDPYTISVPALGVQTFHPEQLMEEWKWIDASTMRHLLRNLQNSGQFDFIIVEGAYYQTLFESIWSYMDKIMWILIDDMAHMQKMKLLLQRWDDAYETNIGHCYKQVRIVLNRYIGAMHNQWSYRNAGITGFLPYIPAWKQIYRLDQCLQSTAFQTALTEWASRELWTY